MVPRRDEVGTKLEHEGGGRRDGARHIAGRGGRRGGREGVDKIRKRGRKSVEVSEGDGEKDIEGKMDMEGGKDMEGRRESENRRKKEGQKGRR